MGIFEILSWGLVIVFFYGQTDGQHDAPQYIAENIVRKMTSTLDVARGRFCIFKCTKNAHQLNFLLL